MDREALLETLRAVGLHDGSPVSSVVWSGRAILFAGLCLYTPTFAFAHPRDATVMQTFLYGVYFVLHEAGHPIFGLFGSFIGALGGTLMQVLVPAAGIFAGLRNAQPFTAAVCTWWTGGSLTTCAPYIYDARLLRLPLHGGGTGAERPMTHDWFNVLSRSGLINHDQTIAWLTQFAGAGLMLGALAWGAVLLRAQWATRGLPD